MMWIFIVLLIIAAVLVYGAMQPSEFSVVREADIAATAPKVFGLLNDFNQWAKWSPWEKMDLTMQKTFSGSSTGKGSVYQWKGNKKVGEGRMEILDSQPSSSVSIDLQFITPFKAHNQTLFTLEPRNGQTHVKWTMSGNKNFVMKLMGVFMDMDKMVGKDFEAGLANMKAEAEKN
jgi:uncharacterized protein YndB with AHSA1/START domain